ncbi:MAG TPA: cytochrome b/b6 domain-containing protein [Sphingomonas sp.]
MSQETSIPGAPTAPRWDAVVRLTHWGIVVAVIGNALVTEEGSGPHVWLGYGLAALLTLRLLWGFIGPREARFSAFPPSPRRAFAHIRQLARGERVGHASHNPLGALNVYAIWACLAVIVGSGIAMAGSLPFDAGNRTELNQAGERGAAGETGDDDTRSRAPADAATRAESGEKQEREEREDRDEGIGEVHETAVYLLYLLIALHLAGVVFETRRNGPNILARMMPGRS